TRSLATSSSRVDRPTTATNSTASLGAGSSMPPPHRQPEPTTDEEQDGGGSQRRLPAGRVVSAPHVEGDRPDAARQRHYLDDQQSEHLEQERQQDRLDHERATPSRPALGVGVPESADDSNSAISARRSGRPRGR